MRVMGIGIFGKSKVLFRDRIAKQFAAYSIVSRANWMMSAGANLTAAAVRLWLTLMTRAADSAIGVFRVQSVMEHDFLLILQVKYHLKCL
ncbi:hypothetical protein D3C73_1191360 [compost metagenome]